MTKDIESRFSMINISLKNGSNFGCSAVLGSQDCGEPAITFISSGAQTTVLVTDITNISISVDSWCPRCE